jgi:hypothetical protein
MIKPGMAGQEGKCTKREEGRERRVPVKTPKPKK